MPMPIPILLERSKKRAQLFLLEDRFNGVVSPGFVNGTRSTSGAIRSLVDTNSKISISVDVLNFATGAAINDAIRYPVQARQAGKALYWRVTPSNTDGIINLGWDADTSGAITDYLSFAAAGVINIVANGGTAFAVGAYTAVPYRVWAQQRGTGLVWYIMGGAFTKPTLLCVTALGTAAGYPALGVGSGTTVFTADDALGFMAPLALPALNDSFVGAAGALSAHAPDGLAIAEQGATPVWVHDAGVWVLDGAGTVSGTPSVSGGELVTNSTFDSDTWWSKDTGWTISGGVAVATTAANHYTIYKTGVLTAGVWYLATLDIVSLTAGAFYVTIGGSNGPNLTGTGTAIPTTGRAANGTLSVCAGAANTSGTVDNVSYVARTLSSLFATVPTGVDGITDVKVNALTTGTQAGLVARLDSAETPANFIIAYFDGAGNVKIDECIAGTYAALASAAKVFTSDDTLRLALNGSAWRLYHITSASVSTLIGNGVTNRTAGTLHGLFSTHASNTFSEAVAFATGTGNEYNILDQLGQ